MKHNTITGYLWGIILIFANSLATTRVQPITQNCQIFWCSTHGLWENKLPTYSLLKCIFYLLKEPCSTFDQQYHIITYSLTTLSSLLEKNKGKRQSTVTNTQISTRRLTRQRSFILISTTLLLEGSQLLTFWKGVVYWLRLPDVFKNGEHRISHFDNSFTAY